MKKLITFALVCLFGIALTVSTTGCPKTETKKGTDTGGTAADTKKDTKS